jgi:hypothetical protein
VFKSKRLEVLICYDFYSIIYDEKKDVMFTIKLYLFSIGTITIPIHIVHVLKPIYILDIGIVDLMPKQLVNMVGILTIKLTIPYYS